MKGQPVLVVRCDGRFVSWHHISWEPLEHTTRNEVEAAIERFGSDGSSLAQLGRRRYLVDFADLLQLRDAFKVVGS